MDEEQIMNMIMKTKFIKKTIFVTFYLEKIISDKNDESKDNGEVIFSFDFGLN